MVRKGGLETPHLAAADFEFCGCLPILQSRAAPNNSTGMCISLAWMNNLGNRVMLAQPK
jgi:hypothetical protein